MSANKAQFIATLASKAGIALADAQAATDALPEALGQWLKDYGAGAPGEFSGEIENGMAFSMGRDTAPAPHWEVRASFTAGGLADFGDGSSRFGLPVENA